MFGNGVLIINTMPPKVAIVYLSFHCEPYIDDVVGALRKMTYPKDQVELVIVDDPHPEHGSSVRFLQENVMPLSGAELPHVTILSQEKNLGFSGGNNVGIKWALDHGFDYVYFHNNDGFVAANFLEPLIAEMEKDKNIGAAQSLLLMYPDTDLINSSGNSLHYLGMGFCNNIRVKLENIILPVVSETAYASGAAIMMRADLLREYGLWDEDFFLYHEDIEYCLRLRAVGYKIVTVRDSVFYHKYSFGRNKEKFYYIERNRWGILLMFYKLPTLLLLLPMLFIFELGLLVFAGQKGWLDEKVRVYDYWFNIEHLKMWLEKRKLIRKMRKIGDKELMKNFVGRITFDDMNVKNSILDQIGNPMMDFYWKIAYKLISW